MLHWHEVEALFLRQLVELRASLDQASELQAIYRLQGEIRRLKVLLQLPTLLQERSGAPQT